jgi:hypothetical protein
VEIAVRVGRDDFVIGGEGECCLGFVACLEAFALAALRGVEIDPLDQMLFGHGMLDGTDLDGHGGSGNGDDGDVLLFRGIDRVGHEFGHFFAAADHLCSGGMNHADKIAALFAHIEFGFT